MLVKFQTAAYADIVMFGDVAVTLLKLMGHSGTVPGALLAEDIPAALQHLRAAVANDPNRPLDPAGGARREREESVSLGQRALPLIELLQAAQARGTHVLWDA